MNIAIDATAGERERGSLEVPLHLRNAPTRLMKELGYAKGYRYAHDEPDGYAAGESYWPEDMQPQTYYEPLEQGLESRIRERLQRLRALDAANPAAASSRSERGSSESDHG